jgi:hypothetical protein
MTDIVPDPRAIAYWCRGATTGSTLVALCAGKQHAAKPASVYHCYNGAESRWIAR